jgi:hypothetical protein
MKLVMVYRAASESRMAVETFLTEYKNQTGREVETLDPDTIEGEIFTRAHDVVEYPTLLALRDDGTVDQEWRGEQNIPTISEASAYN